MLMLTVLMVMEWGALLKRRQIIKHRRDIIAPNLATEVND